MNVQFYRDSISHHGVGPTIYHAAYRAAKHVTPVAVWNAMTITLDMLDDSFLADPRREFGRMVPADAMRSYVKDPANMLSEGFIDEAVAKGDRCYALFDYGELMSYGWYSTSPTRLVEVPVPCAPTLHFDPRYAYMYHGFTHPKYRGQRLHAIGMAAALEELTDEGLLGLVSYVDSANFSSLKSCYRMGYESFGHVLMIKVGGRYHWRSTPGCKKYDFRVEPGEG